MRILLTGGAGYIGSQCALELLDAGHQLVIYDNLSSGSPDLVPEGAELVVGDVRDPDQLHQVLVRREVEAIMHFAALVSVPASFRDPLDYYDVNVRGLMDVLKAAKETKVRFVVFSSTAAVYAPSETAVDEAAPIGPISPYGRSKSMAERILQDAAPSLGLNYAILRYFNVAGADPAMRAGQLNALAEHLFNAAMRCASQEVDSLTVFGDDYPTADGTGVRDFIHVQDLARLHGAALDWLQSGRGNEIFNCGYGKGASVLEVTCAVSKAAGRPVRIRVADRRPGDLASVVADSAKARSTLRWAPLWDSIEDMARHAWQWRNKTAADPKTAPHSTTK